MVTSFIVQNMSAEDIKGLFDLLTKQIQEIKASLTLATATEYLTRAEVAKLLKCDISTVHNWTKKGKLIAYTKGNRVYYKLSEIEESMVPLNRKK